MARGTRAWEALSLVVCLMKCAQRKRAVRFLLISIVFVWMHASNSRSNRLVELWISTNRNISDPQQHLQARVTNSPNFRCLYEMQDKIAAWARTLKRKKFSPLLASVVPSERGLIRHRRKTTYKYLRLILKARMGTSRYNASYWNCVALDGNKTRPLHFRNRPDPFRERFIMDCPSDTTILEHHPARKGTHASSSWVQYHIPSQICPWLMKPAYLSACTMIKGEPAWKQFPEWMAYHSLVGVEHFYVYVNERIPNLLDPLTSPINDFLSNTKLFNKVSFIPYHDDGLPPFAMQFSHISDCLERARGHSKWVTINDVDEYFQIMNKSVSSLPQLLQQLLENGQIPRRTGAVVARNLFFYHPKRENDEQPFAHHSNRSTTTIELYPYRKKNVTGKGRQKCIFQPQHSQYTSMHSIEANGSDVDPWNQLRSNHYKWPLLNLSRTKSVVYDDSMARWGPSIRKLLFGV